MESTGPVLGTEFRELVEDGFRFVDAADMRTLLLRHGSLEDWHEFAASWDRLGPDTYLAKVGRRRRRRHGVYAAASAGPIVRQAHQPHYQSSDYNTLQGDIERWFEPIEMDVGDGPSLHTILEFSRALFSSLAPEVNGWHVEVHQFRIEAKPDEPGEPTPEGVHRDGVDYVLVLLVDRRNIASGTTTIHSADGTLLGSFTLTSTFDAALVDDSRVFHGVTAVTPLDATLPAHRDVLVVTFRRTAI
ncbi:2OG-Fe dioxygenase family protein [Lysobacter solisilvae (ex Woo and Kim 2020)]|uniref:2OG-Fe dioxygenase family protein n=1 Tax=Agrilutibacter terrestris TaxID=2865112 RepID=A0A7H0FZP6_9GAMM|nr:2OG-Fe dioxygenase family protein [Lysobacter terrestris]QNP41512.1 2OG-Fe dioxygenase family protein [Lysobacter terrestris]